MWRTAVGRALLRARAATPRGRIPALLNGRPAGQLPGRPSVPPGRSTQLRSSRRQQAPQRAKRALGTRRPHRPTVPARSHRAGNKLWPAGWQYISTAPLFTELPELQRRVAPRTIGRLRITPPPHRRRTRGGADACGGGWLAQYTASEAAEPGYCVTVGRLRVNMLMQSCRKTTRRHTWAGGGAENSIRRAGVTLFQVNLQGSCLCSCGTVHLSTLKRIS